MPLHLKALIPLNLSAITKVSKVGGGEVVKYAPPWGNTRREFFSTKKIQTRLLGHCVGRFHIFKLILIIMLYFFTINNNINHGNRTNKLLLIQQYFSFPLYFFTSVWLSVCLSVCLFVFLFLCLYVFVCMFFSVCLYVCLLLLSVCLFVCLSGFLYVCLPACLSDFSSVRWSVNQSAIVGIKIRIRRSKRISKYNTA